MPTIITVIIVSISYNIVCSGVARAPVSLDYYYQRRISLTLYFCGKMKLAKNDIKGLCWRRGIVCRQFCNKGPKKIGGASYSLATPLIVCKLHQLRFRMYTMILIEEFCKLTNLHMTECYKCGYAGEVSFFALFIKVCTHTFPLYAAFIYRRY